MPAASRSSSPRKQEQRRDRSGCWWRSAAPEHVGLGTGTQLGMAVARALALAAGREDLGVAQLARLVGRGLRSGLGAHGFGRGGFLVEAGQSVPGTLAPLVAWSAVPDNWRVVLVLPGRRGSWHGARERDAFNQLASGPAAATDRLCRLVLLGMLPALAEADLDAFGAAVHEYNALAGEAFAALQGGIYVSPPRGRSSGVRPRSWREGSGPEFLGADRVCPGRPRRSRRVRPAD